MSPNLTGVVPSIDMVIFTAVGGRLSLFGAVYGALLINFAKTAFSEAYPNMWMFFYGGLFIGIVMLMPRGLAGIYTDKIKPAIINWYGSKNTKTSDDSGLKEQSEPVDNTKLEEVEQ